MEKRKPHYLLRDIKAAFADPTKLNAHLFPGKVPTTSKWMTREW